MRKLHSLYILFLLFSNLAAFANQYSTVEKDGKIGLADQNGNILIPYLYEDIGWSQGSLIPKNGLIGFKENNLWGLLTLENQKVSKALYSELIPAKDGYFLAAKKGRFSTKSFYGVINEKAKTEVPFSYEKLMAKNDYLIAAYRKNRQVDFGLISYKNKVILPFDFYLLQGINDNWLMATYQNGKKFLIDKTGNKLLPFEMLNWEQLSDKYLLINTPTGDGLINQNAELVIPNHYKKIQQNTDGTFNTLPFARWNLLSASDEDKELLYADEVRIINENWICLSRNGQLNLYHLSQKDSIHLAGELVAYNERLIAIKNTQTKIFDIQSQEFLAGRYDSVYIEQDLVLLAEKKANQLQWKLAKKDGELIVGEFYQEIKTLANGFLLKQNDKWGYLSSKEQINIAPQYDIIIPKATSYFLVQYQSSWGLLDSHENWIIPPQYREMHWLNEHLILAVDHQLQNHIFHQFEKTYSSPHQIKNATETSFIEKNHLAESRIIDYKAEEYISWTKNKITNFENELIIITEQEGQRVINPEQKIDFVIDLKTEIVSKISEQYIKIKKDGKYGFIDLNGKLRIANRYDDVKDFHEDRAAVKIAGGWGFVNHSEQLMIQPSYAYVSNFRTNRALVQSKSGLWGLIETEGKELIPCQYDSIEHIEGIGYLLIKNDKKGLAGLNGEILLTAKYDELLADKNGYVRIQRNGKFGLITEKGINTIPLEYDRLVYDEKSNSYLAKKEIYWEVKFKSDLRKN